MARRGEEKGKGGGKGCSRMRRELRSLNEKRERKTKEMEKE